MLISKHAGEGEPLVLLNGIGTTRHDFMQVHGQLTADCAGAADGTALPLQRPAVPQNPPRKGVSSARKPSRRVAREV